MLADCRLPDANVYWIEENGSRKGTLLKCIAGIAPSYKSFIQMYTNWKPTPIKYAFVLGNNIKTNMRKRKSN